MRRPAIAAATLLLAIPALAHTAVREEPRPVDVSRAAGVGERAQTWSANVHDFDRDGWDDVLIVRHRFASARLYRNDRGRFEEVERGTFFSEPGSGNDRHDCAWGDANADGRPDVYCTIGGDRGRSVKENELWLQQPDGGFVDRADAYGVADPYGRGRYTTFVDVDEDGFQDLYIGNAHPRSDGHISRNRLFINEEGGRFRSAPEYRLNRQVGGRSVQAVDYDRDGWQDLAVCGQVRFHLLRNVGGEVFRDVSERTTGTPVCQSTHLADADGDRLPDLMNVDERRVQVKLQRKGEFRRVYSRPLQHGASLAVGDVNGDRRPDLYVLQRGPRDHDAPDLMLVNDGSGRDFTRIGIPQTRAGVGDMVETIDHDRNGLADFFVLNGHNDVPGPIRLVAFR